MSGEAIRYITGYTLTILSMNLLVIVLLLKWAKGPIEGENHENETSKQ